MGVSIEMWRYRIGCFSQPIKLKTALHVLIVSYSAVSLSIRITLFLLLAMHDVEQNPGPRSRGGNVRGVDGRGARTRGQGRGSPNIQNESGIFSQQSDAPLATRRLSMHGLDRDRRFYYQYRVRSSTASEK